MPYRSHTLLKIKKTYRIDEKIASELDKYAKEKALSKNEIVESAIQSAIQSAIHENEADISLEALIKQLEVKDQQIIALSKALETSQRAEEQSKMLHAQAIERLALPAPKRWFQRK